MKKPTIFYLFLLLSISCSSQPLIETGKTWNMSTTLNFSSQTTTSYKFEGDSTINGTTYKKLFATQDSVRAGWYLDELLREEENGKVYQLNRYTLEEYLLYDFSLEEGDTFIGSFNGCTISLPVQSVDSVTLNNDEKRKRISFETYATDEIWIEGIGSLNGLLNPGYYQCIADVYYELLCYKEDGVLIYDNPYYESCYINTVDIDNLDNTLSFKVTPNPFKNSLHIDFNYSSTNEYEIHLLNLQGTILRLIEIQSGNRTISTSEIPSGMYFIQLFENGKLMNSKKLMKRK